MLLGPTSRKTTKFYVEAFEAGVKKRLNPLGIEQVRLCIANFLHPFFKGSLLKSDDDDPCYFEMINHIKSLFKETESDDEQEEQEGENS